MGAISQCIAIAPPNVLRPAIHWNSLLTHWTGTCSLLACLLRPTVAANAINLGVGFDGSYPLKGPVTATERRVILVFVDDVADAISRWTVNWNEDGLCSTRQIKINNCRCWRLSPLSEV